jgi:hypothetical protein
MNADNAGAAALMTGLLVAAGCYWSGYYNPFFGGLIACVGCIFGLAVLAVFAEPGERKPPAEDDL